MAQNARRPLAEELAAFMLALHRASLGEALARSATPHEQRWPHLLQVRQLSIRVLEPLLSPREHEEVARWWDGYLADAAAWEFEPVLLHADLGPDNLLVDHDGSTSSVCSTGSTRPAGDPALDFRAVRSIGPEFQQATIEGYLALGGRLEGGRRCRLQRYSEQVVFYGILMAARRNDQDRLARAMHHLRERGILSGG